jgi:outer membrane lipoprotein SlyB
MKIGVTLAYTPGSCSSGPCESPTGYAVEKQAGSGEWQKAVILPAGTMDFIDETNIEPRKRYNYRALAFAGFMDTFDTGISAAKWSQQGILRNSANTIVVNDTTPPVLASDPANGTLSIAPTSSGGIQMATSSTGGGQVNSYNYTRLNLLSPSVVHGNFDVTIEYRLPEAPVTAAQYHVYGRLHVSLPTGAGTNYAYVERSANAYGAVITIDDFQYSGSIATTETSGKLRITRNGNRITAYAWTGGEWKALSTATGASAEAAIGVNFSQYVQRNEAVSLKILIDNIEALSNRSDYSQVKPVDTPVFATSHGSCQ